MLQRYIFVRGRDLIQIKDITALSGVDRYGV